MRSYAIALALSGLFLGFATAQEEVASELHIKLCILQGNPLGNGQAANLQVISRPEMLTHDKQAAKIHIGQDFPFGEGVMPVGIAIQLTPEKVKGGKIQIEMHGEISGPVARKDGAVQINASTVRYLGTVKLGEVNKVNIGEVSGQKTWLEFRVEEVVQKARAKAGPGLDGEKKPR